VTFRSQIGREKRRREMGVATSFDAIVADKLRDPEFARHYAAESARIAAIDVVDNELDEPRGCRRC